MPKRLIKGGALSVAAIVCALAVSDGRGNAQSGTLPTGWSSRDIGSVGVVGSASEASGTWTLEGSGANVWSSSDEFRYAYQAVTGDLDIRVRVQSVEDVSTWTKAGVMIRESLADNARNAFMFVTPGGTRAFQLRTSTGGSTSRTTGSSGAAPVWLRLVRQGSQFTGYLSANGTSWTTVGTATISMTSAVYVGLAVGSRVDSTLATAVFTNVQITSGTATAPAPAPAPSTTTLPAPWTNGDIGGPALAGSASAASGTFTVTGAGTDIWSNSDQFQFVYQPLQGDVEVIARVASLQYADSWSKAGVMIRESLAADSRHVMMVATGTQGWSFQRRIATGGISYYLVDPPGAAPGWVRLVRGGDLFSAYYSTDGTSWRLVGTDTIAMASTVYVGLAVTSHNTAAKATATFTNVTARTATTGTNQPPTVSITSPSSGTTLSAGTSFVLSASAGDTDGTVAKVDLFQGTTLLKSDVTAPYSVSVTLSTAGSYQLSAVATDSDGATATAAPVSVTVNTSANQAPTVSLTAPAAGATYPAPASIGMTASATDADGTVARVDFYQGSTLIGSDTTSPYSTLWSSAPAGSYSLTARAVDNAGATGTSTAVAVNVTATGTATQWTNRDIGAPALAGSASVVGDTFTVTAGGWDIWATSDEFQFVYQPLQGDVEVIARVGSLQYADSWSKAGVMIRETLAADSRHVMMGATGTQGWSFQRRIATGGTSYYLVDPPGAAPGWVRLVRRGDLFSAYYSTDGTSWRLVGTDTIAMASTVYVGLAVTSHNTAATATAAFTNVTARTATTGTNQAPTVSLTAPAAGATYTAPASIGITASASDADGTVARVDFYRDTTLIGSDTTSPYSVVWSGAPAGSYSLTARAVDNAGATRTSTAVSITVGAPTNQLPTVAVTSPISGQSFTAPASLTIAAAASDTDGTIAGVDFYVGTQLISTDTTSPYSAAWSNVAAGSYSLTAVARDNAGGTRTSTAVAVTVTAVAPVPTTVAFTASADHATSVTSYTVAIYRSVDAVTASPVATRDLGKPTPVNGDISVNISTLVDPLPSGSYYGVVRAVGPGGTTAGTPLAPFTK